MKIAKCIIFRYLTKADFFNIYKPSGTERLGGGQAYIDFPVASISLSEWHEFFKGIFGVSRSKGKQGPRWKFDIKSIGVAGTQRLTIYQRRKQTVCIAGQRITSSRENRINAWRPSNGFPEPVDPTDKNVPPPKKLAVFLVRTTDGEFWAGWFRTHLPCKDKTSTESFEKLFGDKGDEGDEGDADFIDLTSSSLLFDTEDRETPFQAIAYVSRAKRQLISKKAKTEKEVTVELLVEDKVSARNVTPKKKKVILNIRARNTKAVKNLKKLYKGKCQLTGNQYTFLKRDGRRYSEAHHLMPLGQLGADSPFNIIIVSPLIHRMLHYAKISKIDFHKMAKNNTLDIKINRKRYRIKWHPKHAKLVRKYSKATNK